MTNRNAPHDELDAEIITKIARLAWEKLTLKDIERVFGPNKALAWTSGQTGFIRLWYYATAIQQEDMLEILNGYLRDQPVHLSKGETI